MCNFTKNLFVQIAKWKLLYFFAKITVIHSDLVISCTASVRKSHTKISFPVLKRDILFLLGGEILRAIGSAYWDTGNRKNNEDSLIYEQIMSGQTRLILAMVADGIGGLPEGEVASGFLIEKIVETFQKNIVPLLLKGSSVRKSIPIIRKVLYKTGEELTEYALVRKICLGSTLSLLLVCRNQYLIVQLGDSAIYRCRGKNMKKISISHNNKDGSINRCVGSVPYFEPFIKTGFVMKNTGFLVCSDGFYKKLDTKMCLFRPGDIEGEEDIDRRLREGASYVKKNGEKDNISAIYVKLY